MECNKDEAIRAKEIAEKKMANNDFEGAKRMVLKAQNLYPELENVSQMLAVCNVHCSVQNKMSGSEKDWYSVLQIERLSDGSSIRKQYRRLALLLHPDKNRFPGAEAAFKLVGEANLVLSDPTVRSLYDKRIRVSVGMARANQPPHHASKKPPDTKYSCQNNWPDGYTTKINGLNQSQRTVNPSAGQGVFSTHCPFCNMNHHYQREFVNRAVRCLKCLKAFIACDLLAQGDPLGPKRGKPGVQGMPPKPTWNQDASFQRMEIPNQGTFGTGAENKTDFSSGYTGSQRGVRMNSMFEAKGDIRCEKRESQSDNLVGEAKERFGLSAAANTGESGDLKSAGRDLKSKRGKRGREHLNGSCESSASSISSDVSGVAIDDFCNAASEDCGVTNSHCLRRSSRQRQNVSYNETESGDDDFVSPLKKSRGMTYSGDSKMKREETLGDNDLQYDRQTSFPTDADNVMGKMKDRGACPLKGTSSAKKTDNGRPQTEEAVGMRGSAAGKVAEVIDDSDLDPDLVESSNKLYYDFPDPEFGDFDKHKKEICFCADQIWACYDTFDGMPRFYAQVRKILSPGFKLQITWLEPDSENEAEMNWAKADLPVACGRYRLGTTEYSTDHLIFSHQVHCEKGKDRGSFVVYPRKGDIWALFKDWDIRWSSKPEKHKHVKYEYVEVLSNFCDKGIKVSYLHKVKGFVSLFQRTSQCETDSFLIPPHDLYKFSHKIPFFKITGSKRKGVPEGSFELDPACLPIYTSDTGNQDRSKTDERNVDAACSRSTGINDKSLSSKRGSAQTNTVDGEGKNTKFQNQTIPPSSPCKDIPQLFYNFARDKSEWKFQVGQLWALYSGEDASPRRYAQVKKINQDPFSLNVSMLEAFSMSRSNTQPVCGLFRIQSGKPQTLLADKFSHLLKPTPFGKNRFEIYPQEGEIWALYRNWSAELSLSNFIKNGYDVVEVLERNEICVKLLPMVPVEGFQFVFWSPGECKSSSAILEINHDELARFSHQIPAFKLSGQRKGLPKGCWELDAASLSGNRTKSC